MGVHLPFIIALSVVEQVEQDLITQRVMDAMEVQAVVAVSELVLLEQLSVLVLTSTGTLEAHNRPLGLETRQLAVVVEQALLLQVIMVVLDSSALSGMEQISITVVAVAVVAILLEELLVLAVVDMGTTMVLVIRVLLVQLIAVAVAVAVVTLV
jgi:hypothetical protein